MRKLKITFTYKEIAETILYTWNQSDKRHKINQHHIKLLPLKKCYFSLSLALVIDISML